MDPNWQRAAIQLVERLNGPLHARFFLQPTMAAFLAIRDGIKDARVGGPPYFRTIFTDPTRRKKLLENGVHAVAKILILAILLDAIYQFIAFRWFYPGEAIFVAFLLAFLPYVLIRGPANRIAKWWIYRRAPRQHGYGVSR